VCVCVCVCAEKSDKKNMCLHNMVYMAGGGGGGRRVVFVFVCIHWLNNINKTLRYKWGITITRCLCNVEHAFVHATVVLRTGCEVVVVFVVVYTYTHAYPHIHTHAHKTNKNNEN